MHRQPNADDHANQYRVEQFVHQSYRQKGIGSSTQIGTRVLIVSVDQGEEQKQAEMRVVNVDDPVIWEWLYRPSNMPSPAVSILGAGVILNVISHGMGPGPGPTWTVLVRWLPMEVES